MLCRMPFNRPDSPLVKALAVTVCAIAVIGTTVFDWTWSNPEGNLLPLGIGVAAATLGVFFLLRQRL